MHQMKQIGDKQHSATHQLQAEVDQAGVGKLACLCLAWSLEAAAAAAACAQVSEAGVATAGIEISAT